LDLYLLHVLRLLYRMKEENRFKFDRVQDNKLYHGRNRMSVRYDIQIAPESCIHRVCISLIDSIDVEV
jgi:hypothetical protein